jgi:small conductance mechanosensitive channel
MDRELLDEYKGKAIELALGYLPNLALALVTLIVGLWLIGVITRGVRKGARKRGMDKTLTPFVSSLTNWGLKAVLLISVAAMIGVQTTSFVAVLGAAGLAVGLALQGSLANFAGGVLILLFRPFKVGDLIEAQGQLGTVQEIQIFTTTLLTPQNRRAVVPNGPLSNGNIVNYSAEGQLRVDLVVGVAYGADIDKAKQVLLDMLKSDARVLAEPAPVVEVVELADSSVNFAVRPFTKVPDYWGVYFSCLANAKKALDKAGISIPFPQRDVHIHNR